MKNPTCFTLLMLAALLLVVPLAVPQPVGAQSGTELVPGTYRGWVFLYADLTTHQSVDMGNAKVDFNVRAKWKTEGRVNVVVTGKDAATASLKLEKFTVSNSDNNFFGGGGQTCSWYAVVLGRAMWTTPNDASYDKEMEDFEFPLEFWGVKQYTHTEGSVGGSIKGCDERAKPKAIDAMMLALDQVSENWITALSLMVYEVGMDGSISGKCLIPGFEGQTNIKDGYSLRTSTCHWAVFPVQEEKKGWWQLW